MFRMNINPNEASVLTALVDSYSEFEDFCFMRFSRITEETRLERAVVRRACRSLTRKGLAQFGRGLWTEDGEPAGSGYAATSAGRDLVEKRRAA